ncbi:MAG: hypothetical protein WAU17_08500, partial [Nitrospirales bacterium]
YRLPRTRKLDPIRKGRTLYGVVLARGIRPRVEHRMLVYRRKTGIFSGLAGIGHPKGSDNFLFLFPVPRLDMFR